MTVPTQERAIVIANNQTWEEAFVLVGDENAGDIISQSKVHLTVRPTADSTDVPLHASVENGLILVNDAASGSVTMLVHAVRMRGIKAGAYVYDLIVERPTGRVYRLFAGSVTILQGITDPTVTPPAQ